MIKFHPKQILLVPAIGLIGSLAGVWHCYHKCKINDSKYGEPQYHKYIIAYGALSLLIACISLICYHRYTETKNENSSKNTISSDAENPQF